MAMAKWILRSYWARSTSLVPDFATLSIVVWLGISCMELPPFQCENDDKTA